MFDNAFSTPNKSQYQRDKEQAEKDRFYQQQQLLQDQQTSFYNKEQAYRMKLGENALSNMQMEDPMGYRKFIEDAPMQYKTGGIVKGKGTATSDSNPALLSKGEAVINAGATQALQEILAKLGTSIDELNAQFAPKDAETMMDNGVMKAAAGVVYDDVNPLTNLTDYLGKKAAPVLNATNNLVNVATGNNQFANANGMKPSTPVPTLSNKVSGLFQPDADLSGKPTATKPETQQPYIKQDLGNGQTRLMLANNGNSATTKPAQTATATTQLPVLAQTAQPTAKQTAAPQLRQNTGGYTANQRNLGINSPATLAQYNQLQTERAADPNAVSADFSGGKTYASDPTPVNERGQRKLIVHGWDAAHNSVGKMTDDNMQNYNPDYINAVNARERNKILRDKLEYDKTRKEAPKIEAVQDDYGFTSLMDVSQEAYQQQENEKTASFKTDAILKNPTKYPKELVDEARAYSATPAFQKYMARLKNVGVTNGDL